MMQRPDTKWQHRWKHRQQESLDFLELARCLLIQSPCIAERSDVVLHTKKDRARPDLGPQTVPSPNQGPSQKE